MANVIAKHKPHGDDTGVILVTRQSAAYFLRRHPDQISRHCEPIACDTRSRLPLYDMDAVFERVATLRRRRAA